MEITVDGTPCRVDGGQSILEAVRSAGVYVPSLCAHPNLSTAVPLVPAAFVFRGDTHLEGDDLSPLARGCGLCAVEVNGEKARSCATPVAAGMAVTTSSPALLAHRRAKLGEILAHHPHACLTCAQAAGCSRTQCSANVPEEERCCELFGRCELQRVAAFLGVPADLPRYRPAGLPPLAAEPLFSGRGDLCIACLRCVRACRELREVGALSFVMQDGRPVIGASEAPTRAESHCRFCGACVEVCPTGALMDEVKRAGGEREGRVAPCRSGCPAGIDIPRFLRHLARNEPGRAIAVIRERVPLAFAASYACFHPCEAVCRRGELNQPISVCRLKRFAADHDDGEWRARLAPPAPTGKRVAVIGSGPAGLTAAYYLARKGHAVDVHEALPEPGGMLRYGILEYRFPRELLDRDVEVVRAAGARLHLGSPIDAAAFEALVAGSDAVFVAAGAGVARDLDVPGRDLAGVELGLDLLRARAEGRVAADRFAGQEVAVIGGGNVALDVARAVRRLGAAAVTVVSLEGEDELPAHDWEVEDAAAEEIRFLAGWGPRELRGEGGRVTKVVLKRCTRVLDAAGRFAPAYDEAVTASIDAAAVLLAIGQAPSSAPFAAGGLGPGATLAHDPASLRTRRAKVWTGGDVASGPRSLIDAVAAGRRAAAEIDRALGGDGEIDEALLDEEPLDGRLGRIDGFAALPRRAPSRLAPAARVGSFALVEDGFSPADAAFEAARCLACDLRLALVPPPAPPARVPHLPLTAAAIAAVPAAEGVYELLDEAGRVSAIRGVPDLRAALEAVLAAGRAGSFRTELDPMYTKRESELLQRHLQEHGELPGGGAGDLDELF
ncbi:MAG: FAD-dependent oxidoreductase [Planctomycetota bacterium]